MAERAPVYDRTLRELARVNAGAREAIALEMPPASALHYATHYPHGIGRDGPPKRTT